jgi:MGT family glycosyltransferase
LAESLVASGYSVVYYNTATFLSEFSPSCTTVSYPPYEAGYDTKVLARETTFFDFAELLLNTADSVFDFLLREAEERKPDLIIHSHLAIWGKMLARRLELRSVTVYTTFVLMPEIMLNFFRNNKNKKSQDTRVETVKALELQRKYVRFYKKYGLRGTPDIWDAYINKGDLNICFILLLFQPQPEKLGSEFRFVGYPLKSRITDINRTLVYISFGTIFNNDPELLNICIEAFRGTSYSCLIAIGAKISRSHLRQITDNISIVEFIDQPAVLHQSKLFITRGGMASVHEAILAATPMIVIPEIPEQVIIAETIDRLGIGIHLPPKEFTVSQLRDAIDLILEKQNDIYVRNMNKIRDTSISDSAADKATGLIKALLN